MPRARRLLEPLVRRHDVREAWLALAAACRRGGDTQGAAIALGHALSGHALTDAVASMAEDVARDAGAPGWCGWSNGAPVIRGAASSTRDDGDRLHVTQGGIPLMGSPLRLDALRRVEGFVACEDGALYGWAWHPADPDHDPVVTVIDARGRRLDVVARDQDLTAAGDRPLARPRALRIPATTLARLRSPLHIVGEDGRDLLGSPLDPAAGAITARPAVLPPPRPVTIVIPVHGGGDIVRACLNSVLAARGPRDRIVVVDDASPDAALSAHLRRLAATRRIALIVADRNRGFPASANAGIGAAAGRDVVLLNSDTLVPPGWLDRLRDAAYAAPDIGTVSPLSNDATILSYPMPGAPAPDLAGTVRLAALAGRANPGGIVDVPTTVGFCMYLRHDCVAGVGALREDVFAQGYGEEVDFCMRARALGWRHVAATGAYVAHVGATSFGAARTHLLARNTAVLNRLHPGYAALVADFLRRDPIAPARRRMDRLRLSRPRSGSVILITHDEAGGVERRVAAHCDSIRAEGLAPIVLRPVRLPGEESGATVSQGIARDTPNLRFALPSELPALVRLLRGLSPRRVALHHGLGHDPSILTLPALLGIPNDVHVHDYAWLCPRITLVDRDRRYCGEPPVHVCEACIADSGSLLDEPISVTDLRARSAFVFAAAARVVVPSGDTALRIRRHFPAVTPVIVPHEDDTALPPVRSPPMRSPIRICIVGAIGVEKGLEVLLAVARDAAWRGLPLQFTLVGYSNDDRRLIDAGVFVTGAFDAADAEAVIRAQGPDLAFLPSVWPETWCFALSDCWRAGLDVVAFDIGAVAERIRASGRGALIPLGLPASDINAVLMATSRGH